MRITVLNTAGDREAVAHSRGKSLTRSYARSSLEDGAELTGYARRAGPLVSFSRGRIDECL